MKTITLLLDGAGDRTYKELGDKTPLEYASTPNLDEIAKASATGLLTPLEEGVSLGTDLAHFLLFGYGLEEYPNRAVIDAIGEKVVFSSQDLMLRASFADVSRSEDGYMLKSRFTKDLSQEEIRRLIPDLDTEFDGLKFTCIPSYDSHCFIRIQSDQVRLSPKVSDSDPFYTPQYAMLVEAFETDEESAIFTASAINRFLRRAHSVLHTHSVNVQRRAQGLEEGNFILTKWAGLRLPCEDFKTRNGMSVTLIGASKLLEGLSQYIGMDFVKYENFKDALHLALDSDKDYVHLHTKAPDEASHKKNPFLKVKAIEEIDRQIAPLLSFEGLLIVTADHSTPCSGKMIHSGESVPFMAKGTFVRRDTVKAFSENACAGGGLRLTGSSFMKYIHSATDRGNLFHLRAGSRRRNFRPLDVKRL